ncbi:c-type cytochrome [Jannaschia formosa]|uniref:c-type cytochrome n=1 Tax=Jannaschia formosa TaxID=2259592 RepID=UPI000E1C2515|nr:cytochrome c [Jannaschia formosa]TFL17046.1 cytochrome c [Jannaschia formosa]
MKLLPLAAAAIVVGSTVALAQGDVPAAVKARQGQMQIQSHAISILGGMARGNMEYDAELASQAAQDLRAVSMLSVDLLWPEGTSTEEVQGTRALPAIWSDWEGFLDDWEAFNAAVDAVEAAAPNGLEALQPAIGTLGQSCGACHDDFRQSN